MKKAARDCKLSTQTKQLSRLWKYTIGWNLFLILFVNSQLTCFIGIKTICLVSIWRNMSVGFPPYFSWCLYTPQGIEKGVNVISVHWSAKYWRTHLEKSLATTCFFTVDQFWWNNFSTLWWCENYIVYTQPQNRAASTQGTVIYFLRVPSGK